MGWKRFKEYFNIEHIVQIQGDEILIGSPYSSRLLAINTKTGEIFKNSVFNDFGENNYPKLIKSSKEKIISLINEVDSFSNSFAVYTYEDDQIFKKYCEEYGYPNITHDGCLMYENVYFKTKEEAVNKAFADAERNVNEYKRLIGEIEKDLAKAKNRLKKGIRIQKNLTEKY